MQPNINDDSGESCYLSRRKRRRLVMSSRRSLRISARQRLTNTTGIGSSYLTRRTMGAIKEEQEITPNNDDCIFDDGQDTKEDVNDEDENDETVLDDTPISGMRKNTRQRKSLCKTLNQSWIIGSKVRDFGAMETLSSDDKIEGDSQSNGQFDDMYSRVKNLKRRSEPKLKKVTTKRRS